MIFVVCCWCFTFFATHYHWRYDRIQIDRYTSFLSSFARSPSLSLASNASLPFSTPHSYIPLLSVPQCVLNRKYLYVLIHCMLGFERSRKRKTNNMFYRSKWLSFKLVFTVVISKTTNNHLLIKYAFVSLLALFIVCFCWKTIDWLNTSIECLFSHIREIVERTEMRVGKDKYSYYRHCET